MPSKNKWAMVSDLVRILANHNEIGLNDTDAEMAHEDLANIMDYMITQKCGFKKALAYYREEDISNAEWIEAALEQIK